MKEFQDNLAKQLFGVERSEAIRQSICVDCKQPAHQRCYSPAGLKEYRISGLCEVCFDKLFSFDEE